MVPYVSSMGRELLITMVGDLSNGCYLSMGLILGSCLLSLRFLYSYPPFWVGPICQGSIDGLLVLDPSSSSSPHKDHSYYDTEICFTLIISVFLLYVFCTFGPMQYMIELDFA